MPMTDGYFAANLNAILARSNSWQDFKNSRHVKPYELEYDWWDRSPEPSPLRRLALAVLAEAVKEAASRHLAIIAGASAIDWLCHWELVEPWCRIAEIPPKRLKLRIAELLRNSDE